MESLEDLQAFERVAQQLRSEELLPAGIFDVRHLQAIHYHLFQDVYDWAGQIRTVRLGKGDSLFCFPEHISSELASLFRRLAVSGCLRNLETDEFATAAAHFLAELNAIHAFREGNGRTQLAFMSLLASQAGHPLNFRYLEPEPFLAAMIASFAGDEGPLRDQLNRLME
ncbi:MAG: Fic family protein [bacterium]